MKNTFVLGLGNQKCGTTWLYKYLAASPLFIEGFAKEYHIWDALDVSPLGRKKVELSGLHNLRRLIGFRARSKRINLYDMQNDPDFYFDYFSSLYSRNKSITADITPTYCALKAARLQKIKQEFSKRRVVVKAVILIREPLRRIKSAVRFNLDRGNYHEGINDGETDFEEALKQYYKSEHCSLRTRYNETILEAKKAFGEDDLYIGFYENMFSSEEISRLSNFLEIEPNEKLASIKVNKTRNAVEETDTDAIIKSHYSDVYEFCFDTYPITRKLWCE